MPSLLRLFLKLGITGFGGPAAHIGMMEDEVVSKRGWLTRAHFLDLVGATNLIPGPNSTEMAIHIGYIHAGVPGLLAAGAAFIAPAFLISTALALVYVRYGSLPQVEPILLGIKPVVVAIILGAVVQLGRSALKGWRLAVVGAAVLAAALVGVNEVLALLGGALAGMLWLRLPLAGIQLAVLPLALSDLLRPASDRPLQWLARQFSSPDVPLLPLALFFLRIGAVLYGSGYVLVAFLEGELVHQLGWLSQAQLLDAISAGQFTPGPVLSTSAFIGYLLAGIPGAIVSATAIFLPSFIFVLILNPLIPRLRDSRWSRAFLDAANVSAVALMAAVTLRLSLSLARSWPAVMLGLAAAALRLRWRLNPSLLILGGGAVGWLLFRLSLW